jgi:hypothetical protein
VQLDFPCEAFACLSMARFALPIPRGLPKSIRAAIGSHKKSLRPLLAAIYSASASVGVSSTTILGRADMRTGSLRVDSRKE